MPEFPTCESQGKGLLSIRDVSGTTLYYSACIDIGTAAAPSIVRLPLLPPGEYLAELTVPRTQQQRDEGDTDGGTLSDEFTIYPLPSIQYEVQSGHQVIDGIGQWTHTVTYYISGDIVTEMTYEDGLSVIPVDIENGMLVKNYTSGTYYPKFRIHEPIRLSGVQFDDIFLDCFSPIDPDTGLGTVTYRQ